MFARLLRPGLQPDRRLLDVGGGTGALAALLARVVPCRVTVADASPQMLRYSEGLPNVETVVADAAALPFGDAVFDAALVCDAFHHFVDQTGAVRELARVVRPGGTVVVAEADAGTRGTRMVGVVERLLGEPAAFLTLPEMERLMAAAGIDGSCERHGRMSYVFRGQVTGAGVVAGGKESSEQAVGEATE